jgi:hypothetical protein
MQAKPKIFVIFVVALTVSLILGACGGGTSGKTWFNLPSVNVRLQTDGTARVWGFNAGYVIDPGLIQQLQTANIQKLEIRAGYEGILIYANGEMLPYVVWNEPSVNTLQDVLRQLPDVQNNDLIASMLPWLRTIGLGVALHVPVAPGATALAIPRWSGETPIVVRPPGPDAMGPITVGSLVFDPDGQARFEGIPAAALEQALGMSLPALDANTLQLLRSINAQSVRVQVHPYGIDLGLNNRPLPGLRYDGQTLANASKYAAPFVADPATAELVNTLLGIVPNLQVELVISFTGEQLVETRVPRLVVVIDPEGTLNIMGLPVAQQAVPADVLQGLQRANVQQLNVALQPTGLVLAANAQPLPTLTWTPESLDTIVALVAPLTGWSPEVVDGLVGFALNTGLDVQVDVPLAEGTEPLDIPDQVAAMQPPADGALMPVFHLSATVDQNQVRSVAGLTAEELSQLGIDLPALPPEVGDTLSTLGVRTLQLSSEPGALNILFDGSPALAVAYDEASLLTALDLATAFMEDSPLSDPAVALLIREQVVPMVPNSDVNVTVSLP